MIVDSIKLFEDAEKHYTPGILIVPSGLDNAIKDRISDFINSNPDCETDREFLYDMLLKGFYQYGVVGDILREPELATC